MMVGPTGSRNGGKEAIQAAVVSVRGTSGVRRPPLDGQTAGAVDARLEATTRSRGAQ